jgi:hypothetical protein
VGVAAACRGGSECLEDCLLVLSRRHSVFIRQVQISGRSSLRGEAPEGVCHNLFDRTLDLAFLDSQRSSRSHLLPLLASQSTEQSIAPRPAVENKSSASNKTCLQYPHSARIRSPLCSFWVALVPVNLSRGLKLLLIIRIYGLGKGTQSESLVKEFGFVHLSGVSIAIGWPR